MLSPPVTSVATASRALNGVGRMQVETRERVRDTALRLGFRPNEAPRSRYRRADWFRCACFPPT